MKEINFYEKLVIVTLAPIIVLGTLGLSYTAAMRWHQGPDRNAIESRQQVKVRHASASLLVLFLVGFQLDSISEEGGLTLSGEHTWMCTRTY